MSEHDESTTAAPADEPDRDVNLWFSDGNIVVIAEIMSFRVHKGVLSRHSTFFENMFGVPQPTEPDPADLVEDCPVVRVSDPASDFKCLLHMLYDGFSYFKRDKDPTRFQVLLALARLGRKYEFDRILDAVDDHLDSLAKIFPSSFGNDGWDVFAARIDLMQFGSPAEAVILFRLLSPRRDDMLPTALYLCSTSYGPSTLLLSDLRSRPTLEDAATVLELHIHMLKLQAQWVASILAKGTSKNCTGEHCSGTLRDKFGQTFSLNGDSFGMGSRIMVAIQHSLLCSACRDMLVSGDLEERKKLWKSLPDITKVHSPGWMQ